MQFYNNLAIWRFSSDSKANDTEEKLTVLKNSARNLMNEIKNLPPDMVRPQVVEHIEKSLALK